MRYLKYAAIAAALVLSSVLGGCSSTQLASFQSGLANFQSGVASVDQTIATVSPTLAKYCNEAVLVGNSLSAFTSSSSSAGAGLAGVNAAITTWCQRPPTDIKTAIASVAAQVAAAKAAYQAAKRGN